MTSYDVKMSDLLTFMKDFLIILCPIVLPEGKFGLDWIIIRRIAEEEVCYNHNGIPQPMKMEIIAPGDATLRQMTEAVKNIGRCMLINVKCI